LRRPYNAGMTERRIPYYISPNVALVQFQETLRLDGDLVGLDGKAPSAEVIDL
jgi:hypothetical protein